MHRRKETLCPNCPKSKKANKAVQTFVPTHSRKTLLSYFYVAGVLGFHRLAAGQTKTGLMMLFLFIMAFFIKLQSFTISTEMAILNSKMYKYEASLVSTGAPDTKIDFSDVGRPEFIQKLNEKHKGLMRNIDKTLLMLEYAKLAYDRFFYELGFWFLCIFLMLAYVIDLIRLHMGVYKDASGLPVK